MILSPIILIIGGQSFPLPPLPGSAAPGQHPVFIKLSCYLSSLVLYSVQIISYYLTHITPVILN